MLFFKEILNFFIATFVFPILTSQFVSDVPDFDHLIDNGRVKMSGIDLICAPEIEDIFYCQKRFHVFNH